MDLKLLRNANVYTPQHIGIQDLLIANDSIVTVGTNLDIPLTATEVIDMEGRTVIPGLIDGHVHVIGGGGEDGYESRVPPLKFSDTVAAGVTTLVGVLGTDGITRSLTDLLAATKALSERGISAYCLTGSYEYPSRTLTSSVGQDIVLISEVLGVKIAVSDHRCSLPTTEELTRLAMSVRIAGLLSHKPGVVHVHVGNAGDGIAQLLEIVRTTPLPPWHLRPTHMGTHMEQALEFTSLGGYVDFTAGQGTASQIIQYMDRGGEPSLLTLSSDSNGSFPKWNERRQIIGMTAGKMTSLFGVVQDLVHQGMPLEDALPVVTTHVATAMQFRRQGSIEDGKLADLVVLDDDLQINSVMAKGKFLMQDKQILVKGMYE